jgi:hypothetical protein
MIGVVDHPRRKPKYFAFKLLQHFKLRNCHWDSLQSDIFEELILAQKEAAVGAIPDGASLPIGSDFFQPGRMVNDLGLPVRHRVQKQQLIPDD